MYYTVFIHSFANGHLNCFHVLAIVNSTAMNTEVYVSFWIMVFSGYVPRSGIFGLYDSSIFSFLRNLHIVLHSSCTNSHSHWLCRRVLFSPHPLQHLIVCRFFWWWPFDWFEIIPHCSFFFIVVLICISLIMHACTQ